MSRVSYFKPSAPAAAFLLFTKHLITEQRHHGGSTKAAADRAVARVFIVIWTSAVPLFAMVVRQEFSTSKKVLHYVLAMQGMWCTGVQVAIAASLQPDAASLAHACTVLSMVELQLR